MIKPNINRNEETNKEVENITYKNMNKKVREIIRYGSHTHTHTHTHSESKAKWRHIKQDTKACR